MTFSPSSRVTAPITGLSFISLQRRVLVGKKSLKWWSFKFGLCGHATIPVWLLRGVSVSFWEESFDRGIFGWTWGFTAFGIHWDMGVLQSQSWQVCMQWCPNPLAGSFIFSCQHAMLPSCIQSFKSSPKPPCIFSKLSPIWGYVYQLRKDFWPRSPSWIPSNTLPHLPLPCYFSGSLQILTSC